MPFRKQGAKERWESAVTEFLEPEEQRLAGVPVQTGPGFATFALLDVLTLPWLKQYYLAVTDRRVLFVNLSKMTSKPRNLAFAEARSETKIFGSGGGTVWKECYFRRADGTDVSLKYHFRFEDEMREVKAALGR
jgi:hypothetical protein